MAFRGDEPEYFDDDFFDPDDRGDADRGPRVLGGSGSRRADDASYEPASQAKPGGSPAARSPKARNPAPSLASSEERRARLAGKKVNPKDRRAREESPRPQPPKPRLEGLRARFSPGKDAPVNGEKSSQTKRSRLASIAGGIGRGLRHSIGSRRPGDATPTAPSRASKAPRIESSAWLDLDRKLDIIGVALVFGAVVIFFSAISPEQAAISAAHAVMAQLLGWGAPALPIGMFALGLWLIARHFGDQAPVIDLLRLGGLAAAFLGVLILFQFVDSLNYGSAMGGLESCRDPAASACVNALVQAAYQAGRGGGLIGGWLYSALVNSLTEIGAFVAVFMILTIATMMLTRSSVAELALAAVGMSRGLRARASQYAAKRRFLTMQARQQIALSGEAAHVRVSKPQAARLEAADDRPALPEPRAETMSIPLRLRGLFARGVESRAELAIAPPSVNKAGNWMRRLLGERAEPSQAQPEAEDGPVANRMERFLNLGDNIPPSSVPAPAWQKPPRPGSSAPAPPPPPVNLPPPVSKPAPRAEVPHAQPPEPVKTPAPAPTTPSQSKPETTAETKPAAPKPAQEAPAPPARGKWQLPDFRALLNRGGVGEMDREPLLRQAQVIEDTLASFGAPGKVVEVNSGPVITQYGVEPLYLTTGSGKRSRVKVGAIAKLDKDLQLALGARSIRVEAPVPGKGYVGIELPNPASARVGLRDVMESRAYQQIDSPLAIALGVSVDGTPVSGDLTQMPHLLIAGATGSGKSVCVNAIINSILVNNSPDAVKFIMVDPKRVELTGYNGLPHLVAPVVVELERTVGVLRWVTVEMDERYKKFSRAGARNIVDYNSILDPDLAPMPYIVVIIDELADLMMMAPDDTERAITRIAALARATGIHLVIATQRPSVDVVTGLIKANCPARIAFAVAGSVDSRVILDQPGAERLLGKGDMLYLSGDAPAPRRMQGVHVSNEEISRILRFWKMQSAGLDGVEPIPLPVPPSLKAPQMASDAADTAGRSDSSSEQTAFWDVSSARHKREARRDPEEDELYAPAVEMVRRLEKASISLLQRRLRIGYTRAARLMDMMEERGIVGPPKEGSSKPRDVLPFSQGTQPK